MLVHTGRCGLKFKPWGLFLNSPPCEENQTATRPGRAGAAMDAMDAII
jgi:hypothetical protein